MGCTASIVLLQAFRSVVQRSCPHICRRRQEEPSHEIVPLESDDEMSRPRTLIMVLYAWQTVSLDGTAITEINATIWEGLVFWLQTKICMT